MEMNIHVQLPHEETSNVGVKTIMEDYEMELQLTELVLLIYFLVYRLLMVAMNTHVQLQPDEI
jgi:hypothetical protein